jgi:predicted nucleic acid-binding protein
MATSGAGSGSTAGKVQQGDCGERTNVGRLGVGLCALTNVVTPASVPSIIPEDSDDDNVLACALAADANLVVSGDRHLLNLKSFMQKSIVEPAEAMRIINRSRP